MVYWTLDLLRSIRVEKVVLAVNYLADMLRSRVGMNYRGMGIEYSLEKSPMGTGGPIELASETTHLDETFVVVNGDVVADIDLDEMLRRHEETKASVTDALHYVENPSRFGSAEIEPGGRIRRFVEKPKSREAPSHLINAGIYIIEPEVINMIPPNRKVSLEREIFPRLAKDGKLFGFPFSGDWFDIGSFSDYQRANFSLLKKYAMETTAPRKKIRGAEGVVIHPPVILGRGTKVRARAIVGPRVVAGSDNVIETRAKVLNSILFDKVEIGAKSLVSGAILASGVVVGEGVRIEQGSVVSPYVRIRDGVKIGRNAIIHPHKEIDYNVRPATHAM